MKNIKINITILKEYFKDDLKQMYLYVYIKNNEFHVNIPFGVFDMCIAMDEFL